jgi:hypothetical protein
MSDIEEVRRNVGLSTRAKVVTGLVLVAVASAGAYEFYNNSPHPAKPAAPQVAPASNAS